MGTIRNPGLQFNVKGVTQGNTLVDPNTGLPISVVEELDGSRRLAVDANLSASEIVVDTRDLNYTTDNVAIKGATGNELVVNSDGSLDVNTLIDASTDNIAIADATTGYKLAINSDGSINVDTNSSTAATPTIFNVSVPLANSEVSQILPANTKKILLKVRNSTARLQLSFTSGNSGTNYISLSRGAVYEEDNILVPNLTIYFQTNSPGQVVEILTWN